MNQEIKGLQNYYECLEDDIYRELCGKNINNPKILSRITQFGKLLNNISLNSNEKSTDLNCFDNIVSLLKQDAIDLQKRFTNAKNDNDYKISIDVLRLLKDTLSLIKEYDWKLMYSEYETGLYTNETLKKQVAIWEQNSEGNIRNHKVWDIDSGMRITLHDNQR